MKSGTGYDRLARAYRWLERLAFGDSLMRARLAHLEVLEGATRVLIVGEGDGRFLRALCRRRVKRVVCVEQSGEMIALARRRLMRSECRSEVEFRQEDIRVVDLEEAAFDVLVTLFVLDVFDEGELAALVPRLAAALRPGGVWLLADFAVPAGGLARRRAQLWLWLLYRFFGLMTVMSARELVPPDPLLARAGLVAGVERVFEGGLLRSLVFRKAP